VNFLKKSKLFAILILLTLFSVNAVIFQIFPDFQSDSFVSQTERIPKSSSSSGGGYLMDVEADFNWEEINTTGTLMGISSQDNGVETILFSEGGWNFTFYETEYDIIYVRSDGWMTFPEFNTQGYWHIPHLWDFNIDFVALLMSSNGLNPSLGGDIYYEFLTSPNRLIIEYSQIYDDSSQLVGDFQVIFYENGTIKFQYKHLYDDLWGGPTIGLDHGDTLNYNSYIADLPVNSIAIEFTFDEMIYPNYGFEMKENDEYEYILTKLNNKKLETYFGLNWEQVFSLPLNPYRADKLKIKISSISENTTDFEVNYDIWGWQNRFTDFPISYDLSESLSYKKNTSDYTQRHNLTNIIPIFLPNQTNLYLSRANISYHYSSNLPSSTTALGYSMDKFINGHHIYLAIVGFYDLDGSLLNKYIRWRNQTSNGDEIIFNMEPLKPSFLVNSSLEVQSGDEHQWLLTKLDESIVESIFGANWEGMFGLPENSSVTNKIKIKIESTSDNLTHWNADYSLWDWVERDSNFDISPIKVNSVNYLKDAFNYSMPHNYGTIFPFLLPKPVEMYLSYSNLDESFYSIQPYTPSDYIPRLSFSFNVGGYYGSASAYYSMNGYLTDIKVSCYTMMGPEITIFQLTHFNTEETPQNVMLKLGNEFNYNIFNYSENKPLGFSPLGMFKKVNLTLDYVSGDDFYLNRTIVLLNYTLMDTMGKWYTNYSLRDAFYMPVSDVMYIHQDAIDCLDTIVINLGGYPFMVTTDMDWEPFIEKFKDFIPAGYNINITAFSNGYMISQAYYSGSVDMQFNFTSYGVLESFAMKNDGDIFHLVQLNYSSIETEMIDPIIIINSPSLNDWYETDVPYLNITIEEDYLVEAWYTLDGGLNNITHSENNYMDQTLWNSQTNGPVLLQFYAKDYAGNVGHAEVLFYKDIAVPIILINSPIENQIFSHITPMFNLTITEANFDSLWYTLDNGLTNITITSPIGTLR